MQSILFGIANSVIMIAAGDCRHDPVVVFGIGGAVAIGGVVGIVLSMLVWLIWLLFWLVGLGMFRRLDLRRCQSYQGQMFKLPIIGNMAEKIVNK